MIEVTVYQVETGQIVSSFATQREDTIGLNVGEGQGYILGLFDDNTHWIREGEAVPLPPRPSGDHHFDFSIGAWVSSAFSSEELAADLLNAQTVAIGKVNETCGSIRAMFVTVIPFQETTYADKEKEAAAFVVDDNPSEDDYPYIFAEVGETAPTAFQVAQVYLNKAYLLRSQNAGLEKVRIAAITAIENASERSEIDSAALAFDAAIAGLPF